MTSVILDTPDDTMANDGLTRLREGLALGPGLRRGGSSGLEAPGEEQNRELNFGLDASNREAGGAMLVPAA